MEHKLHNFKNSNTAINIAMLLFIIVTVIGTITFFNTRTGLSPKDQKIQADQLKIYTVEEAIKQFEADGAIISVLGNTDPQSYKGQMGKRLMINNIYAEIYSFNNDGIKHEALQDFDGRTRGLGTVLETNGLVIVTMSQRDEYINGLKASLND